MVHRIYVEKKGELAHEARALAVELRDVLGIDRIRELRILNRYDVEGIGEDLFAIAVRTVFSEPQLDRTYKHLRDAAETVSGATDALIFAVEYLPGQFDQRADSAAQCIQMISQSEKPLVRSARVYLITGSFYKEQIEAIKKYIINPVEAREASLERPETLAAAFDMPGAVETLTGFRELNEDGLAAFIASRGLAMDLADITFCRDYFREERRDPTITEIRMIDTYWSDHCRHTTFLTEIDGVEFQDDILRAAWAEYLSVRKELGRQEKPICLMDLATVAARYLRANGELEKLDESEEINACTVKMEVEVDGKKEPWLLLFKNETHNHPTEIEPFGGAATCIGGAIRDPLSGRAYVYGAMRVTGASNPTVPIEETLPGKLPQRKLVTTAAAGYSSYGNQIGLATGIVDEIYHPGYVAKHMEIGAVIAAAPAENVRRERPEPGDVVILVGGSTGRDGIGGATGSSKSHDASSVEACGAEVQKGNAPEERKLQRLFRNAQASRLIKRCNDFGAGGVSVAIGELADGLEIDLNAVPKKYEGLDGTELAISESQERMAVVVAIDDVDAFLDCAAKENLQACLVARVTKEARLVMHWNGDKIVDISREFLNSNGAAKHIVIGCDKKSKNGTVLRAYFAQDAQNTHGEPSHFYFSEGLRRLAADLNHCSRRGLAERFDSTIGAGTVLMPFGGKYQRTPIQAMVHKIPVEQGHTEDCSFMSWAYDPELTERDPYRGAYRAVVDSICKLVATGASFEDVYLTFQEYFGRPGSDGARWSAPLAALLGAFKAQMDYRVASIGGKDSMSGTFEDIDVPPTLVSFAVTTGKAGEVVSPEFKKAGHSVVLLVPEMREDGLPKPAALTALFDGITAQMRRGHIAACMATGSGGIADAVMKMAFGNGLGFSFTQGWTPEELFRDRGGCFVVEADNVDPEELGGEFWDVRLIGETTEDNIFLCNEESVLGEELFALYEDKLEEVYPTRAGESDTSAPKGRSHPIRSGEIKAESQPLGRVLSADNKSAVSTETLDWAGNVSVRTVNCARPRVLIPAFPGTNCEYDSAKAMEDAGAEARILVVRNRTGSDIKESIEQFARELKESQMIFLPGGFSGGDEPEGSAKFIAAFFRNQAVREGVTDLLENRDGLICGICNGFQALIKLGLVPYGRIIDTDADAPTLTFNTIARHQSRIVRTKVVSKKSPWLAQADPEEIYYVPISHGEGRFFASEEMVRALAENGQIATQYVDFEGNPSMDISHNPNGSVCAIEGITDPTGRVFGKMGHSERKGTNLYRNVPGNYDIRMFESAVNYLLR